MILTGLIQQLQQRFQHEKRAQVCLWFDAQREFRRLLPGLQSYLGKIEPPPFRLLIYEPQANHGQIWMRRQVRETVNGVPPNEVRKQKFVFYLPLSEERLDSPDEKGQNHLEFFAEYRIAGVRWLVNGKRPTLFNFLRLLDVPLPDNATQQRRLFEGRDNSLLAKYVAKFQDHPAAFWNHTVLTPEVAQSRLVGDLDQLILDLAVQPEATWASLERDGLLDEFLIGVRERYDFECKTSDPVLWIGGLVEILALTETFLGYGEPPNFPFVDRLPAVPARENHQKLLRRWLRDANSRPAWDRWVELVEEHIDLSAWAKGRPGISFAFRHLVQMRWNLTYKAFAESAAKESRVREFVDEYRARIRQEVDYAKASSAASGSWDVLGAVTDLVDACEAGRAAVRNCSIPSEFVKVYVKHADQIDLAHWEIKARADEIGLPEVARVADRFYGRYANELNHAFFEAYMANDDLEINGLPFVTDQLDSNVWSASGRRAVIIIDAFRYDCGLKLAKLLRGLDTKIEPMRAMLPTRTPIGMSALLPKAFKPTALYVKGNELHPERDGIDTSVRENRLKLLQKFGADCVGIDEIEQTHQLPGKRSNLLVVFGHEEVDSFGHGNPETLIRHLEKELERVVRLVRKVHELGYSEVNIVTDHGFILLEEDNLPPEVPCNKDWCHVLKERFAVLPATADVPLKTKPFPWDNSVKIALPPGLAFFKTEKGFSHGGATLQEMVIPRVISRSRTLQRTIGIEVLPAAFELMQASVKVLIRPKRAEGAGVGQLTLFAEQGRSLELNVLRLNDREKRSVLGAGAKQVRVEPGATELSVTLFFNSRESFARGDQLRLEIKDVETQEEFPPGGIPLTIGRDF